MEITKKTYLLKRRSRPKEHALTITLILYNERKQEFGIHCVWNAPIGMPMNFKYVQINTIHLPILKETAILHQLASIELDLSPTEFEALLKSWGFTREYFE